MAGKGDMPRPFSVDDKTYSDRWNMAFGKKKAKNKDQKKDKKSKKDWKLRIYGFTIKGYMGLLL